LGDAVSPEELRRRGRAGDATRRSTDEHSPTAEPEHGPPATGGFVSEISPGRRPDSFALGVEKRVAVLVLGDLVTHRFCSFPEPRSQGSQRLPKPVAEHPPATVAELRAEVAHPPDQAQLLHLGADNLERTVGDVVLLG